MARVEELPDDFDEKSAHDEASAEQAHATVEPVPALPPHLSERHQTVDELAADLKRSPFFMTSLDDAGDEDNPELDAIRALLYEGSRGEIAGNFREQGNELAKSRQWKDSKEQYTKGLAALKAERKKEDPEGEEEDEKERGIKEALLANRALCHLELRTCGSSTHAYSVSS